MLKNMKFLSFLLILIVLFCSDACVFAAQNADIDKELAAEDARMKELERKIAEHRRKAQQIGSKEKNVLGELSKLEENTAVLQQQNKVLSLKTQKLRNDIDKINNDITATRAKMSQIASQLRLRLINMSRYGDAENMNLFFTSETTHDAINSIYLLERLSAQDQELIGDLLAQEKVLLENNQRLTKNRDELNSESAKLKSKQSEYNNTIASANKILGDVRKQKKLQEQAVKDAEDAQREIGKTIADLMKRKRDRVAAESKSPATKRLEDYTYLAKGSMLEWPVVGRVSSQFGNRIHPVFKTKSAHSGIDIAAPGGTPVTAAGPGEVLYAGWQRGFGQVIIIDHGRNISTVYAHLSAMYVKEGAAVKSKTRIGAVGSTGTATGNNLHFEVRVGADAKDPMRYLKKR